MEMRKWSRGGSGLEVGDYCLRVSVWDEKFLGMGGGCRNTVIVERRLETAKMVTFLLGIFSHIKNQNIYFY